MCQPIPHCWRCSNQIEINWAYCASCGVMLKDQRNALTPIPDADIEFLRNFYSYGWYSRHTSCIALYEGILSLKNYCATERPTQFQVVIEEERARKVLRTLIHAEYMALIEAFGYLCISIRDRNKKSILWSYLNTQPQEVDQFFHSLLSTSQPRSLAELLHLSSKNKLLINLKKTLPADVAKQIDSALFDVHAANIRLICETYCDQDKLNVRAYNKIKHGFPIVDSKELLKTSGDLNKIAVIVYGPTLENNAVGIWRLSMDQERANQDMANVHSLTLLGAEITAICLHLHEHGLLY